MPTPIRMEAGTGAAVVGAGAGGGGGGGAGGAGAVGAGVVGGRVTTIVVGGRVVLLVVVLVVVVDEVLVVVVEDAGATVVDAIEVASDVAGWAVGIGELSPGTQRTRAMARAPIRPKVPMAVRVDSGGDHGVMPLCCDNDAR